MGCYTVPVAAAIIHYFIRKGKPGLWKNKNQRMLNLMFFGGAIFGVVDHWWNGELFAFSMRDMMLGVVITLVTFSIWGYMTLLAKAEETTVEA